MEGPAYISEEEEEDIPRFKLPTLPSPELPSPQVEGKFPAFYEAYLESEQRRRERERQQRREESKRLRQESEERMERERGREEALIGQRVPAPVFPSQRHEMPPAPIVVETQTTTARRSRQQQPFRLRRTLEASRPPQRQDVERIARERAQRRSVRQEDVPPDVVIIDLTEMSAAASPTLSPQSSQELRTSRDDSAVLVATMKRLARFARRDAEAEAELSSQRHRTSTSDRAKQIYTQLLMYPERIAERFFARGGSGEEEAVDERSIEEILGGLK